MSKLKEPAVYDYRRHLIERELLTNLKNTVAELERLERIEKEFSGE